MRRRLLAALLALMLALGGACLADGEEEAPSEPAAEQSAPAPEPKPEPKPEPAPEPKSEPEPEQKSEPEPEPEQKSEPEPEVSNDAGDGEAKSEEDVSKEENSEGDDSEDEVPPASNSEENPDGGESGGEIIEDETSEDETSKDEITEDEVSEDEISEIDLEENPEDESEGDGEDVEASLTVGIEGLESSDGVWHVPAGTASIRFTWNEIDGAGEYAWSVAESGASGSASGGALELSVVDYAPGTYTFTVRAEFDGGSAEGSARFAIEDSGGEPEPDEPTGELAIAAEGATQLEDGAWQFPADAEALRFIWTAVEGASGYSWSIDGSESQDVQTSTALELSARDYASGRFTLSVTARFDDEREPLTATLTFEVAQSQRPDDKRPGGFPGGRRPGGFGGRPSGGSRPSGGAGGELPEEEQGFRVTPGEALTDAHASGTKDMTAYGAAALDFTEESVYKLALSGATDVYLADGGTFAAALEEDTLTLTSWNGAAEWRINPLALRALQLSGVRTLALGFGGESVSLPTDLEFTGAVYASYRARGYVSKDFELRVSRDGIAAVVDGAAYSLNDRYELIQA